MIQEILFLVYLILRFLKVLLLSIKINFLDLILILCAISLEFSLNMISWNFEFRI